MHNDSSSAWRQPSASPATDNQVSTMTAGQTVVVKEGALAGLGGTLVGLSRLGRWIVQPDQIPRGVLVVIGEPHLSVRLREHPH